MKKSVVMIVVLVLLSSYTVSAVSNSTNCSGFWGSISCFLWGSGRGNVVGEADKEVCNINDQHNLVCNIKGKYYTWKEETVTTDSGGGSSVTLKKWICLENNGCLFNGRTVKKDEKISTDPSTEKIITPTYIPVTTVVSVNPNVGDIYLTNDGDKVKIVSVKSNGDITYNYISGDLANNGKVYTLEKGKDNFGNFLTKKTDLDTSPIKISSSTGTPEASGGSDTDTVVPLKPENVPYHSNLEKQNGKYYWVTPDGMVYDDKGKKINGLKYNKDNQNPWHVEKGYKWKDEDPNSNDITVVKESGSGGVHKVTKAGVPATAGTPKPSSDELSPKQKTEATTFNTKSQNSKLNDLVKLLDSDPKLVAALKFQGVDVEELRKGNPEEVAYLQLITQQAKPDGKLGPETLQKISDHKDAFVKQMDADAKVQQEAHFAEIKEQLGQQKTELAAKLGASLKGRADLITDLPTEKDGNLIYTIPGGTITVPKDTKDKPYVAVLEFKKADGTVDVDKSKSFFMHNGVVIGEQSVAEKGKGMMSVSGSSVYVGEGVDVKDLGSGATYYKDVDAKGKGEALGRVDFTDSVVTNTNYKDGTQDVKEFVTGGSTHWEITYYKNGESDCKDANGCIVHNRGTYTDSSGNKILLNVDTTGFGGSQKWEQIKMFDPQTGRYVGSMQHVSDEIGDVKFIQKGDTMTLGLEDGKGSPEFRKGEDGIWKLPDGTNMDTWVANAKNPPVQLTKEEQGALAARAKIQQQLRVTATVSQKETVTTTLGFEDIKDNKDNGLSNFRYLVVDGFPNIIKVVYFKEGKEYTTFYDKSLRTFTKPNDQGSYNPQAKSEDKGNSLETSTASKLLDTVTLNQFLTANPDQIKAMSVSEQEAVVKAMGYKSLDEYISQKEIDLRTAGDTQLSPNELKRQAVAVALTEEARRQKEVAEKQEAAQRQVKPGVVQDVGEKQHESTATQTAQTVVDSIYAISNSFKSYPALSKLLYGNTQGYKDWQNAVDRSFAPMLGSNWFPSTICEGHYDIEPQGKVMIKTASGTYQAVASIQMEKSQDKSPILCQKNPDEKSEQKWICDSKQVCVKDQFCYDDQNEDGQADTDKPLEGYFYKITWAVSAPRDEVQTPYINEDGVAVSFNIYVDKNANDQVDSDAKAMYNLKGNTKGPIQLQNGASDRQVIVKYSPNEYSEACIGWNQAPTTTPRYAGTLGAGSTTFGAHADTGISPKDIRSVCFSAVTSSVGQVNWQRAGQSSSGTTTASGGQVAQSGGW